MTIACLNELLFTLRKGLYLLSHDTNLLFLSFWVFVQGAIEKLLRFQSFFRVVMCLLDAYSTVIQASLGIQMRMARNN